MLQVRAGTFSAQTPEGTQFTVDVKVESFAMRM
jgi:hypothetical protein